MEVEKLSAEMLMYLLTEAEEQKKSIDMQVRILKDEVMRRYKSGELYKSAKGDE